MNDTPKEQVEKASARTWLDPHEELCPIGEVARELALAPHVLRFWETRFPELSPIRGPFGRRLYRSSHVALLKGIKALLHDDGMKISGVQRTLARKGTAPVVQRGLAAAELKFCRSGSGARRGNRQPNQLTPARRSRPAGRNGGGQTLPEELQERIQRLERLLVQLRIR